MGPGGWHAMSALIMALRHTDAGGGELRVAAGPGIRRVLADARVDRLVAVFGSLAEALPASDPPLEPGVPGLAPA
jgi:hypothetical protein